MLYPLTHRVSPSLSGPRIDWLDTLVPGLGYVDLYTSVATTRRRNPGDMQSIQRHNCCLNTWFEAWTSVACGIRGLKKATVLGALRNSFAPVEHDIFCLARIIYADERRRKGGLEIAG